MSKYFLTILLFVFAALPALAQQNTVIEGRISDQQTGEPLIGVNIIIPETTRGTTTNKDGYFQLRLSESRQIELSYIGYVDQQITVDVDVNFLNISMRPDNISLNEVQVIGFDTNKKLQETAASIGLITRKDLERGSQVSLQSTLNTIPGVQMDQSSLSDARISIRGVGIRSNFGIRNIKVYVNGIPLTEADGFTRIEGLDVSAIGRAEVIKGPASSIYGAGTGGVINFQLEKAPYGKSSIEASAMGGSYGLGRLATTYRTGTNTFNAEITAGNQVYEGFRAHSEDKRRFITGSLQFFPNEKQTLTVLLNRSEQETQIPGALTAAEVQENPRQANAGNLEKQAGRYQNWTRVGLSHTYDFSESLRNSTGIYTSFYDLDHPLAFAYIRQPYQSYGGRTSFTYSPEMEILPTTFTVGGEYLNGFSNSKRYVNNGGVEGDIILNQELNNTQYSLFYQSETDLTGSTTLTLGLSLNKVTYDVEDFMVASASGTKNFNAELMPRIALAHVFSDKIALRAGISYGFSPPTTSEITGADGQIRTEIEAEKGVNYEIGARGNLAGGRLNYDVTLFSLQMEDQLVPQNVGPNNTIFNNAGKTSRNGLEAALSYFWTSNSDIINSIRPFISYTFSDFTFEEFRILDANDQVISDFSGNEMTGISPHIISAGIDLSSPVGFYMNNSVYFKSKAPILDDNSVYNDSHTLLNTKIGFKKTIADHFKIDANIGFNNILDQVYTSHVALNAQAFGSGTPPFYNPAPRFNFYTGLSISYIF